MIAKEIHSFIQALTQSIFDIVLRSARMAHKTKNATLQIEHIVLKDSEGVRGLAAHFYKDWKSVVHDWESIWPDFEVFF